MLIKHDNYLEARLPIKSPLPTTLDILYRFQSRYSKSIRDPLGPVLYTCAEETERLICELLFSTHHQRPARITKAVGSNSTHVRISGYRCPKCGGGSVRYPFKHCPDCGRPVEWIQKNKTS
jgi:hypothetical protein